MSRWCVCLLLGILVSGCAAVGGVPAGEIPERAIVLRWYDEEATRRRRDAILDQDPIKSRQHYGVARPEDFSGYVGRLLGVKGDESDPRSIERRYPGRLAFFQSRDGSVEPIEGPLPGSNPADVSPDGDRILFSQLDGKYRQLFEYRRSSGEIRRVTRGPKVHADGCFGPDGSHALLRAEVEEGQPRSFLLLTRPRGQRPVQVSQGPADWGPACAPDGSALAWVSVGRNGRDRLMTRMPALDGKTRDLGPGKDPAFSPDSQWIVYSVRVGKTWQLHRIRPDGSGRNAIGRSALDSIQPAFSPDGRLVVYVSDDGFDRRPYLRRFDGTGDRILLNEGSGTRPVW